MTEICLSVRGDSICKKLPSLIVREGLRAGVEGKVPGDGHAKGSQRAAFCVLP